jgi:hypothetical protein
MPIRLNLLAEAQAEEELRRRDPVKRAIWVAGLFVAVILLWSLVLFIQGFRKSSALGKVEARLAEQNDKFKQISGNEKKLNDITHQIEALTRFTNARFLWGTALNAFQQAANEDVSVTHFRAEQSYATTPEAKPTVSESGRTVIGKPGFVTSKMTFYFDAKDTSATPGNQISKFKDALALASFYGKSSTNAPKSTVTLKNISQPTRDVESGRAAVMFNLECRFEDKAIK